jgi:hypothetical protein
MVAPPRRGQLRCESPISPYFTFGGLRAPCVHRFGTIILLLGDFFLQLYAAPEPAVCIGLFRKHNPPEQLAVGDNYATFFFSFLHRPLLVNALLALSLNRWLDSQDGLQ